MTETANKSTFKQIKIKSGIYFKNEKSVSRSNTQTQTKKAKQYRKKQVQSHFWSVNIEQVNYYSYMKVKNEHQMTIFTD